MIDPDGWSDRLRLPSSAGDGSPAWSPDGNTIAFATAQGDIGLVPALGSPVRVVTSGPALDGMPAWSSDGRLLAFTRQ